jgi:hypothetical protein
MVNERWIGKDVEGNVLKFTPLSRHLHGGTAENHKNLSEDIWSLGWDLNQGILEYETGVYVKREGK